MRSLVKTSTYWVCHIVVACTLAWVISGQLRAALAIGLLEPTVQAFVFLLHERLWEHRSAAIDHNANRLEQPALTATGHVISNRLSDPTRLA